MKAIVVDDEPLLAEYLQTKLQKLWPELDVAGIAHSGKQALEMLDEFVPEVAFLDIHMPGMSGLQLAALLPESTKIVFVTAFNDYAVDAFQHAAIDYLLKPVTQERLELTIKRLQANQPQSRDEIVKLIGQLSSEPKRFMQWLRSSKGEETTLIAVSDIVYFKSSHKYTEVFTCDQIYLVRQSIKELESSLDPDAFWRIHRSVLVRVDQIDIARRDFGGKYAIQLKDRSEQLVCSKSYAHLFRQS